MDLALTEAQQLLQSSIRDYLEREVPFSRVREVERGNGFDDRLWADLQAQGWLGLPFAERYGGSGGTLTDLAVLLEELTRRAVLIPIKESLLSGITIASHAEATVADEIVPRIASGEAIVVPAVLERSDHFGDVQARVADGRLSGVKYFVDYAQVATHFLVAATDGLYLIDAQAPGIELRPLRNTGRIPQAVVTFQDVPATFVCDADGLDDLIQLGRALTAVQSVGCAQQALDMTVSYTQMRVQFGRPIGSFQAVQHHVANMAIYTEQARFLTYEAVWALQAGIATAKQIALAKASASRASTEVPMQAHQLHGGIGFIEEYDLYFFSLRGKQHSTAWGSYDECIAIVAETIAEDDEWLPIQSVTELPPRV